MSADVLEFARLVLRRTDYSVTSADTSRSIVFEDDAILGSLCFFDTVNDLLASWESVQDSFLRRTARRLRTEPAKAWNAYTVLLSSEVCPKNLRSRFEAIEEDFRATRKIAAAGIVTMEDVEQALLPLLPLRSVALMKVDDPLQRVRTRLQEPLLKVFDGLTGDVPVQTLAEWLIDR